MDAEPRGASSKRGRSLLVVVDPRGCGGGRGRGRGRVWASMVRC
jgi:hypothetical protein